MRASYGRLVDLLASDGTEKLEVVLRGKVAVVVGFGKVDLANRGDEGNDLDTVSHLEVALSDRTGSNTA